MNPMRAPSRLGSAAILSVRLCRGLEQDAVDRSLVLVGDIGDAGGQRVHHMEVGHGQKLGLAFGKPLPRRAPLTLRAMPVAAANGRRPLAALCALPVMGS